MFPEGKQGVNPRAVLQYVIRVKNYEGFIYTAQILAAVSRGGRSFAAEGCTKQELCNEVLLEESVLCCLWSALPSGAWGFVCRVSLNKAHSAAAAAAWRAGAETAASWHFETLDFTLLLPPLPCLNPLSLL